jgi:hypothetical protein
LGRPRDSQRTPNGTPKGPPRDSQGILTGPPKNQVKPQGFHCYLPMGPPWAAHGTPKGLPRDPPKGPQGTPKGSSRDLPKTKLNRRAFMVICLWGLLGPPTGPPNLQGPPRGPEGTPRGPQGILKRPTKSQVKPYGFHGYLPMGPHWATHGTPKGPPRTPMDRQGTPKGPPRTTPED